MRSYLTQRGKQFLQRKVFIRRRPLIPKAPSELQPTLHELELGLMSSWEVKVYRALTARGITFTPQVNFAGGAGALGGMRVDFLLLDRAAIIRVQGPWHLLPGSRARDELQRQYLLAQGYSVVDLWEDDILNLDTALEQKLGIPVRKE